MEAIATAFVTLAAVPEAALTALSCPEWGHVVGALGLAPQEARIVELILEGKADKQIASDMRLRVPTVRTYLTRVFQRTGTADRVELVLRVFASAREWRQHAGGPQQ